MCVVVVSELVLRGFWDEAGWSCEGFGMKSQGELVRKPVLGWAAVVLRKVQALACNWNRFCADVLSNVSLVGQYNTCGLCILLLEQGTL
jgi:hypothetical protein